MDFRLTPEHEKIREVSRKLAADFATRAAHHDQETSLPVENYAALKREGFYGLTVPKNLGGWGAGFLGWTCAAEELAQGCPSTALTFNMHVAAVETLMDDPKVPSPIKQRVAALVVREQKLLAYSITEPGASSLALGSRLRQVYKRVVSRAATRYVAGSPFSQWLRGVITLNCWRIQRKKQTP